MCYPRDQRFKLIKWTKAPSKPVHGNFRASDDLVLESQVVEFAFTVARVKGSVKWKYLGAGRSRSTLKLKRWDKKTDKGVDIVPLGECVGHGDDVGTLEFDIEFSSNKSLCSPGEKGDALP